jgi:P27 family predicted phage terminase small subunit
MSQAPLRLTHKTAAPAPAIDLRGSHYPIGPHGAALSHWGVRGFRHLFDGSAANGHGHSRAKKGVFTLKKFARRKRATPPPPAHLSAEAKKWWKEIHEGSAIEDRPGLLILATALEAFDRMRAAQVVISELGVTVVDRWAQVKLNPATTIERDSRAAMLSALRQLNLDIEPTTPKGA